jgi:hypothetical protein
LPNTRPWRSIRGSFMPKPTEKRVTMNEVTRVHQNLRLTFCQCGKQSMYDVGNILHARDGEGASAKHYYGSPTISGAWRAAAPVRGKLLTSSN